MFLRTELATISTLSKASYTAVKFVFFSLGDSARSGWGRGGRESEVDQEIFSYSS